MSRVVDGMRRAGVSALALAAVVAASGSALAQDDFRFQEGSFSDGAASVGSQPAAPSAQAGGSSSVSGSFDTGSFEGQTATTPTEPGQQTTGSGSQSGGEDSSQGGSFADTDWVDTQGQGQGSGAGPTPPETTATHPADTRPVSPPPEQTVSPEPETQAIPEIPPEIAAFEMRDFGVAPSRQLRADQFHAPTPTELPGGSLVSTQALARAYAEGLPMLVVDVLGGQYALPDAITAGGMAEGGHFGDRVQQQTAQFLSRLARHGLETPIVVYCSDPMCWLSYNAALRVLAAGYTNVYWYRGGLRAWQMAGLRVVPAGF